jgi:hypothetical protein
MTKHFYILLAELLLIVFEFSNPGKTSYNRFENYISLELQTLFLEAEVLEIVYRNLKGIIFRITAHIFIIPLGFAIQNHIVILIANAVKTRYHKNIIRLDRFGKNNTLFIFRNLEGYIKKKESNSFLAIFLMWYLSVGATLTGGGIVLRTYT